MQERRKNKRMELVSKILIKRLDSDKQDEVVIDVQDLSKTGVGFKCKQALTIGAVYEAFLTIWTKERLHAFIEIVRIVKETDSFVYGGIFIGMPEIDSNRIEIYDTVNNIEEKI